MGISFSGFSKNSKTRLVASLMLAFSIFISLASCAKFREEFNKGLAEGQRRAKQEKQVNPNEAQLQPTPFPITEQRVSEKDGLNLSGELWKYHPGDDQTWALPEFDDRSWDSIAPGGLNNFVSPKSGWTGIGWFRLHLNVDESLVNQPLGLKINHPGASEIYVDAKLVQSYGKVADAVAAGSEVTYDPQSVPTGIVFSRGGTHTIALRYSNSMAKRYAIEPPAFRLQIAPLNSSIETVLENTALVRNIKGGIFGICLALGLMHLLLYLLYPRQRGNLFYSLFLLAEAVNSVTVENFLANIGAGKVYIFAMVGTLTGAVYFVAFTAYLYTMLENRLPRYLRVMAALWLIAFALNLISYSGIFGTLISVLVISLGFLVFIAVMIWHIVVISIVIVRAVAKKVENSFILGVVGVTFIISSLSSTIMVMLFGENSKYLYISQFICLTALIVANAIFLARQFARTSNELEKQLVKEVEHEKEKARLLVVEAENERRAQELEEARQLQLSMLPKKLPQLPNLEIAAYMKPATEVGGDYYDFHVSEDGTLTVAVGDATGHGLKAGTVVTATKGLFNNLAPAPDISDTLGQISRSLKKMNLRGLFMAMTLLKIKDNRLLISAAGMPSALIYRHATGAIEEISQRALPLGGVARAQYREQEYELAPNDLIVLMSDGFPEMFNPEGEMLGDGEAGEILRKTANSSPQEIIERLINRADAWANGRPPDDDVTFVVLKARESINYN